MDTVAVTNVVVSLLTLVAIWYGPISALKKQRKLDELRDRNARQLQTFKTLMAYRTMPVSLAFVQALNLIDVEFDSPNEKDVRDAWKALFELFSTQDMDKEANKKKSRELVAALLSIMGKHLGYPFDPDHLEKFAYLPVGINWVEQQQVELRVKLIELLNGTRRLPVGVFEEKFPDISLPSIPAKAGK